MTDTTISENEVIDYLKNDLDFFVRNPELLVNLNVNNRHGKVASLSNHQVNLLKEKNSQLKTKLSNMIQFASDNERIMSQIFEVSLKVGQYSKLNNVIKCFCHYVKSHFSPDWIRILLPENPELKQVQNVIQIQPNDRYTSVFSEYILSNQVSCGRMKKDILEFVFNEDSSEVKSSILLPIGNQAEKGILIFASTNESRYHPDMSTDLLIRLAQILESKLKDLMPNTMELQAQE